MRVGLGMVQFLFSRRSCVLGWSFYVVTACGRKSGGKSQGEGGKMEDGCHLVVSPGSPGPTGPTLRSRFSLLGVLMGHTTSKKQKVVINSVIFVFLNPSSAAGAIRSLIEERPLREAVSWGKGDGVEELAVRKLVTLSQNISVV